MKARMGTDIVYIPRFERAMKRNTERFLDKLFLAQELEYSINPEHLAGIFAAKEAVIKALSLPAGSWHKIYIRKTKDNHPFVEIVDDFFKGESMDLSISHDKDYAIATFIVIF